MEIKASFSINEKIKYEGEDVYLGRCLSGTLEQGDILITSSSEYEIEKIFHINREQKILGVGYTGGLQFIPQKAIIFKIGEVFNIKKKGSF